MSSRTTIPIRRCIAFSLFGVVAVWVGLEFSLFCCLWLRPKPLRDDVPFLFQSHPYRAFAPVPSVVNRDKTMSHNSLGLRGPEIEIAKPPDTVRIVCMGGSTTFCNGATTDSHAWPARMERLLRERYREAPFRIEVINAGVVGSVSLESLIYFETRILDLDPDVVLFQHVLNDAWLLVRCHGFRSDYKHARKTFTVPRTQWWEWSPILSARFARNSPRNPYGFGRDANLVDMILNYPKAYFDNSFGSWNYPQAEMLAAFERNLVSFVSAARGHGVIPLLATESCRLLDLPRGEGGPMGEMDAALTASVRRVAARESVPLIDTARKMAWSPEAFYDDCHLLDTPEGIGRKAEIFARALTEAGICERVHNRREQARSTKSDG